VNYPHDIEYDKLPSGRRVRQPKGQVSKCPCCGRLGLRQVPSWSRGRYHVTYWHVGTALAQGDVVVQEMCSVYERVLGKLPKSERDKGRLG